MKIIIQNAATCPYATDRKHAAEYWLTAEVDNEESVQILKDLLTEFGVKSHNFALSYKNSQPNSFFRSEKTGSGKSIIYSALTPLLMDGNNTIVPAAGEGVNIVGIFFKEMLTLDHVKNFLSKRNGVVIDDRSNLVLEGTFKNTRK